MSKDVNWANVDKRIRERRVAWTNEERDALARDLAAMPDTGAGYDQVTIPQPALVAPEAEEEPTATEEEAPAAVAPAPVEAPPVTS